MKSTRTFTFALLTVASMGFTAPVTALAASSPSKVGKTSKQGGHLHPGEEGDQGGEGPSEASDDVSASDSAADNNSQPSKENNQGGVAGQGQGAVWMDPAEAANQGQLIKSFTRPDKLPAPAKSSTITVGDKDGEGNDTVKDYPVHVEEATISMFVQKPGPDGRSIEVVPDSQFPNKDVPDDLPQTKGVFLKSGANAAHVMTLPTKDANWFGTDKLTGCSLVIGGDRKEPTIMHANVQDFRELIEAMKARSENKDKNKEADFLAAEVEVYDKLYEEVYKGAADKVPSLNGDVLILNPSQYQRPGIGDFFVFGTKGEDGWTLYYSSTYHEGKQSVTVTGQLWPEPDFSALEKPPAFPALANPPGSTAPANPPGSTSLENLFDSTDSQCPSCCTIC
jgi:hypothetical protein